MPKLLTLISPEEYEKLLEHFREQVSTRLVYYFDTSDLILKQEGYSIKVTHTTNSSEYLLKVKKHEAGKNLLLENLTVRDFQSLCQTRTLFSKTLTNFLEEHSNKCLMKLGALTVEGIKREESRVHGFWIVHENLYPSGYKERVFGLCYQNQTPEYARSLFKEALRGFEIRKESVEASRRDLFLR